MGFRFTSHFEEWLIGTHIHRVITSWYNSLLTTPYHDYLRPAKLKQNGRTTGYQSQSLCSLYSLTSIGNVVPAILDYTLAKSRGQIPPLLSSSHSEDEKFLLLS